MLYLKQNYPKKTFSEDEMQMPLKALGLAPSAVIITAHQV